MEPGVRELVMARSSSVSNPILNRSSVNLSPSPAPASSPQANKGKSTNNSPGKASSDSSSSKVSLGPMKLKGYSYARLYLKDR
jgi:hypothetical protein